MPRNALPPIGISGPEAEPRTTAATITGRQVSRRLDALPVSRWHRRVVTVVGLGSFFNFFEVALGTLLIPLLPTTWTATTVDKSLLIGAPFAGEMLGALLLSRYADRFGRRRMFQLNLVGYAALALVCSAAPSGSALIVLRVLVGVGLGAELTLVDTYLAELMPAAHRGRLMIWSYSLGMLAIPIAGILASKLPHTMSGLPSWRWMLIGSALGAVVIRLLRRRLPESPRWLAARGRSGDALAELERIENLAGAPAGRTTEAGPTPHDATAAAAPEPAAVPEPAGVPERAGVPRLLAPPLRRRTVLVCVMQALGPVGFYGFASIGPLVLLHKGFGVVDSLGYSALTAFGYPLGALLLAPLSERFQRRTLVIASTLLVGAAGCLFGTATSAAVIVAAGTLTTLFSVVQSTVARAYAAELFPTAVRNTALGRTYALSRLVSAVLPFVALTVLGALGSSVLYAGCGALLAVLAATVAALGPRTNSLSLEAV